MTPEIKAQGKIAPHQFKTVGKTACGFTLQEIITAKTRRRAAPVTALRDTVEKFRDGRSFTHDVRTFGEPD